MEITDIHNPYRLTLGWLTMAIWHPPGGRGYQGPQSRDCRKHLFGGPRGYIYELHQSSLKILK